MIGCIGIILSAIGGALLGIFMGKMTGSFGWGFGSFLAGTVYLFAQWVQAGLPYDIHDIAERIRRG